MKKILFSLLFAMMAICVNAQVTHNVRVGAGYCGYGPDYDASYSILAQYQANIPFRKGGRFTFSPSVFMGYAAESFQVYAPLTVGYKAHMGEGSIFFPKVGFAFGYHLDVAPIVGPTASLDFEIKHFVIGANCYYSLTSGEFYYNDYLGYDTLNSRPVYRSYYKYATPWGVNLTLGYKF